MKKICVVVNGLAHGGVEQVLYNYLHNYDRKEYSFDIIAQKEISVEEDVCRFSSLGFNIHFVTHKRRNLFKNYHEIKRIIKNGNYDIVHSNMSYLNFYVLKLAKKSKVSCRINHYHNVFNGNSFMQFFYKMCNRLCDKYSTYNIFCSSEVKKYFGKSSKQACILSNAVNIEKFIYNNSIRTSIRKKLGVKDNEVLLGHIGRFSKQKNHTFLIDVFFEVRKCHKDYKLLLCGDGELKEKIMKQCYNLELSDSIIFEDVTEFPEQLYNAMDYFVFPSLYEGLGMTFVEAQINGLYCLGSNVLPNEAVITERVKLLSLTDSPVIWANEILKATPSHSKPSYDKIAKYDLSKCGDRLFAIYQMK